MAKVTKKDKNEADEFMGAVAQILSKDLSCEEIFNLTAPRQTSVIEKKPGGPSFRTIPLSADDDMTFAGAYLGKTGLILQFELVDPIKDGRTIEKVEFKVDKAFDAFPGFETRCAEALTKQVPPEEDPDDFTSDMKKAAGMTFRYALRRYADHTVAMAKEKELEQELAHEVEIEEAYGDKAGFGVW